MARSTRRPFGAAAATLVFAALTLSSCAERITNMTAENGPFPEGVQANSDLILHMDTPIRVMDWLQVGQSDVDTDETDDVLRSEVEFYDFGPGTLIGTVIDSSDAAQFDIFRQEAAGGYAQLQDVLVHPSKSWLQSHTEIYRFTDPAPAGGLGAYVGRGIVNGTVTVNAPLTNRATILRSAVAGDLKYLGNVAGGTDVNGIPITTFPDTTHDSLFTMRWRRVNGAAGYWITVCPPTNATLSGAALYRSALPRPLLPERIPESYVLYYPQPASPDTAIVHKLVGDGELSAGLPPGPPGTRLIHHRQMLTGVDYLVRIVAVDANGQMLTYTRDDAKASAFLIRTNDGYTIFPLGFVKVKPTRPEPPPGLRQNGASIVAGLQVGQGVIVTMDQLPAALRP
jgi:hypothetical protein